MRFALCARTVCERYWLASSPLSLQTDWIAAAFRPRCCQLIWIFRPPPPPPNLLFLVSHSLWWQIKSAAGFCLWLGHGNCCTTARPGRLLQRKIHNSSSSSSLTIRLLLNQATHSTDPGSGAKSARLSPFLSLLTAITTRLTNKRSLFYYRTRSV